MRTLSLLLVIAVPANAAGIASMAPSISQEVDHVFHRGGLCQALRCNSKIQKLQDFHMWDDMWWFWLDFYEGRISGLRDGFRRTGDCVYAMGARYFRAMMAEVDRVDVRDVAFSNFTIAWSAWLDDTKADFLWRLRGTLAFWVKHYIQHINFLKTFNTAFVEAQK